MSYEIYPQCDGKSQKPLYYVEYDRGGKNVKEFTLFRRQFMNTEEKLKELEEKSPNDAWMIRLSNELHPWNIFTAGYGPDGSVPDRKWVEWMVDALNEKTSRGEKSVDI